MTRTLRYLLLLGFIGLSGVAFAQNGEISGRVLDDKKEPLINATVQVFLGGIMKGGTVTDYDGNYTIKPLDGGNYNVIAMYQGYDSMMVTEVVVSPNKRTTINFDMKKKTTALKTFTITAYKKPLVDQDKSGGSTILTKEEIATIPTTQVADMVSTNSNVYQSQRGKDVNAGGARTGTVQYIVDGVIVQGVSNVDMAQGSIEQMEVMTSGVPARYGDISGAVVSITSRGAAQKFTGNVRLQHSIDGYNNNLASFSVAGPIYKKKITAPDGSKSKKPVLGFALSGDIYHDNDRYPDYYKTNVTRSDVLANLQKNPLTTISDNSGNRTFQYSSNYITQKDLEQRKRKPNNVFNEQRMNAKFDYQLSDNMRIVAGGSFDFTQADQYNRSRNLFAPEATPTRNQFSGRAFLRFTQKFGKAGDTSSRSNIISNAFYSLQVDYQKTYVDQHHPEFKEDFFKYAYIGKFKETRQDIYFPLQTDSLTQKRANILTLSTPTQITYERSDMNPGLANYTTQYYNTLGGDNPLFMNTIQANNALINGDLPDLTYGMFLSPSSTQSGFFRRNSNQYALQVDASFDLLAGKTKHAIEFGLYYQQRIETLFQGLPNRNGIGTQSIWSLMRQLVSSVSNGNLKYDKSRPLFKVNGQTYAYNYVRNPDPAVTDPSDPKYFAHSYYTDASGNRVNVLPGINDTIFYNYTNIGNSTFDRNLRKKLFAGDPNWLTKDVNIDEHDPSTYSLGMFSADELANSGRSYVEYFGTTYTGGKQSGTVNFNDYWTAKDENGNYTRPIGAFSPNYIAGYIMDKFTYKDLHFNVGVRIDRYSSNQKVLIDPYSTNAEFTVNQYSGAQNLVNGGAHPGNMGGDYVVYVDDNTSSSPSIVGYRSGNNWYDPTGKFIADPGVLKQYTNGRDPQPALVKDGAGGLTGNVVKITDSNYNPNTAFADYTPQVTVQPRISFSFPISDVANFYAHYDIYSQRPVGSLDRGDPSIYYYLQQNNTNIVNNPNLRPQKTFDYEVGFKQKLNDHSALTIMAFYKERKDMITVLPYLYAYPTTYYSYGNRDISTTKGTTLVYDMRTTNHLRMTVSYTLQFAEGSGSGPQSNNRGGTLQISPNGLLQSFIQAGLPNTRYVTALDYDSRHNLVANIDYRFGKDEGPMIGKLKPFQSAGANLIARARSGEPYTRYTDATGNVVIGGVAQSRKAWHYGFDLRVDKDFALTGMRKINETAEGVKPKRPLFLKAIVIINNLLNTRDVLNVYGYTGRPDDNGWLTSPYGRQSVPQQINPQSYIDMYRINVNNPANYNYARTINFALEFNF
ncbi:MAG: TonB-dependent receptor [Flavipsychrobacter sp.]|jgi:hypothetical protein|nr:TonB-dependent receptor [Flavipsychrobacter sp.]